MFLNHQVLWIQTPAANSHFPLPKSEGFRAFLKDWRPSWLLGTAASEKQVKKMFDIYPMMIYRKVLVARHSLNDKLLFFASVGLPCSREQRELFGIRRRHSLTLGAGWLTIQTPLVSHFPSPIRNSSINILLCRLRIPAAFTSRIPCCKIFCLTFR